MKSVRVLFIFSILSVNIAQECKTPGEVCNDDKWCCGGCCIQGICISSYRNCDDVEYLCEEEYCAPGFECHIYKPSPSCIGCDLQRICRPSHP